VSSFERSRSDFFKSKGNDQISNRQGSDKLKNYFTYLSVLANLLPLTQNAPMQDLEVALPLGLLLFVVGIHTVLVQQNDLAAPSGGGFAMFSTFDDANQRHINVSIKTDKGWVQAVPDASDQTVLMAAKTFPTEMNLRRVIDRFRGHSWQLKDQRFLVTHDPSAQTAQVKSIRVVLSKTSYEPLEQRFSMRVVRFLEIP
jgi:hypothetical protein